MLDSTSLPPKQSEPGVATTTSGKRLLHPKANHALALASMGFSVFPLCEDDPNKAPAEIKKPALKGDWRKLATRDPATIKTWWSKANFNIGVATLPDSDLVILDYDMKEGQNGAAAWAAHEALDMPQAFVVRTPSGGLHNYFRAPSGTKIPNSASKIAPNVDVRGNERGGYVVGPGSSIHGKPYEIIKQGKLPELPDWIINQAVAGRSTSSAKPGEILVPLDQDKNIRRAKAWLIEEAPEAIEGAGGNDTT